MSYQSHNQACKQFNFPIFFWLNCIILKNIFIDSIMLSPLHWKIYIEFYTALECEVRRYFLSFLPWLLYWIEVSCARQMWQLRSSVLSNIDINVHWRHIIQAELVWSVLNIICSSRLYLSLLLHYWALLDLAIGLTMTYKAAFAY